ncbi:MAG TPA: HAD hydrolase-like protein [Xanthobacteraceae bacterium]|nr:HAD hydrolase-like protein [Xanthobacteraceae bacterium]
MLERALSAQGRHPPKPEVDRMFRAFVDHYGAHIAERSRPFPHVNSVLEHLGAVGYRLAVCTNKLEFLSVRLLEQLKLSQHFAAICGQDTFGVQKPDPLFLRRTILRAGGEPEARDHGGRFRNGRTHRASGGRTHRGGRFRL